MRIFDPQELQKLHKRSENPENGQVTIIGGSDLFHGAPVLSLTVASRVVDMVFFSSPETSFSELSLQLKSRLSSFIWVPWEEVGDYIKKSDSVLIGPGMKRYHKEGDSEQYKSIVQEYDESGTQTKFVVERLLRQFSTKRWVIDGGALQVLNPEYIPPNAILTPNGKEFKLLFGDMTGGDAAKKYNCVVVRKGQVTTIYSPGEVVEVHGGNNGMTKGGTGDVQAGLTVSLLAQNEPFLAAAASAWIIKRAADEQYATVGTVYNSDDLAGKVAGVLGEYMK